MMRIIKRFIHYIKIVVVWILRIIVTSIILGLLIVGGKYLYDKYYDNNVDSSFKDESILEFASDKFLSIYNEIVEKPLENYTLAELIDLHNNYPDSLVVAQRIDSILINRTACYDLDSLIAYSLQLNQDASRWEILLDTLCFRGINGTSEDVVKLYKANIDNKYFSYLIQNKVLFELDEQDIPSQKEVLDLLRDTPFCSDVYQSLFEQLSEEFESIRMSYIEELNNNAAIQLDIIRDSLNAQLELVTDEFCGGFWSNLKNNMIRKSEKTDSIYMSIWKRNVKEKDINRRIVSSNLMAYNNYIQARDSLINAIEWYQDCELKPLSYYYPIRPDKIEMRSYASGKFINSWERTAFEIVTFPLGVRKSLAIAAGEIAVETMLSDGTGLTEEEKFTKHQTDYNIIGMRRTLDRKIKSTGIWLSSYDIKTIKTYLSK